MSSSLSLFNAPLSSVTVDDVRAFLDLDLEEGTRVDYKQADTRSRNGITETLYRAVTAFANTYGGLIILGVATDPDTNRPGKREGLPLKQGFEEAITSKCYSLIYPPLAPEVRVCPFKSDPSRAHDDRALVVVRVPSSTARPHFIDNRLLVRLNSECRDADPATHRMLFEYQHQQERRVETLASEVESGLVSVRQRFVPEMEDAQKRHRWAPGSHRVFVEFVPLDAPADLLPFWDETPGVQPLDDRVLDLLKQHYWYMDGLDPADMVRIPRGLGVAAVALRRSTFMQAVDTDKNPVDVIYLDSSGALALDMATTSLGWARPQEDRADSSVFPEQLLKRIARTMKLLWNLYQDKEYVGRVQVTIWADTGTGWPSSQLKAQSHRGSTVLAVLDPFEERGRRLGTMVSQMTRSWLGYTVAVTTWDGDSPMFA